MPPCVRPPHLPFDSNHSRLRSTSRRSVAICAVRDPVRTSAPHTARGTRRAQETIEWRTGMRPSWFRAPYGARWFGLGAAQRKMQLTGVMWSAIGYDWSRRANEVVARMAASASNGAILCLHDGRELREKPDVRASVETVRRLVPILLDRGYKFETIGRLLCPKT